MSVPDQSNRTRGIVGGAAAGAVAYVLGYLVVYVTQGDRIAEGLSGVNFFTTELFGGDPISTWQAAGWLFYNAHFVDTMSPGVFGGAQSTNLIMEADGGSLLFILPPLLLLVAGVVAGRAAARPTRPRGAGRRVRPHRVPPARGDRGVPVPVHRGRRERGARPHHRRAARRRRLSGRFRRDRWSRLVAAERLSRRTATPSRWRASENSQ